MFNKGKHNNQRFSMKKKNLPVFVLFEDMFWIWPPL